ncbi:hypothetical protein [Streptomyces arenae]|uniref:hypothetical protein n=1 Tax=Streptomyces arenae TaxID=29301 RepID=UPI002658DC9D|nr:hypothetical protein [Streptomyces arenae]MCG7205354.1 hypothetical protein [Streptomyces arenae]
MMLERSVVALFQPVLPSLAHCRVTAGLAGHVALRVFVVDVAGDLQECVVVEVRAHAGVGGVRDVQAEGFGGDLLEGHAAGAGDEFGARGGVASCRSTVTR